VNGDNTITFTLYSVRHAKIHYIINYKVNHWD
jgi:hypothetical protein